MDYKEQFGDMLNFLNTLDYDDSVTAVVSQTVKSTLNDVNWAGFYKVRGNELHLWNYAGKEACKVIPFGKGVCGMCAETQKTQVVDDVSKLDNYISCDSESKSEIVIPVFKEGKFYAVFDIDSPVLSRFTDDDRKELEELIKAVEKLLDITFEY